MRDIETFDVEFDQYGLPTQEAHSAMAYFAINHILRTKGYVPSEQETYQWVLDQLSDMNFYSKEDFKDIKEMRNNELLRTLGWLAHKQGEGKEKLNDNLPEYLEAVSYEIKKRMSDTSHADVELEVICTKNVKTGEWSYHIRVADCNPLRFDYITNREILDPAAWKFHYENTNYPRAAYIGETDLTMKIKHIYVYEDGYGNSFDGVNLFEEDE